MSPRWSITDLADMPTLRQGQDADLKFDNGKIRVWLSRLTKADGYTGPAVIVETFNARTGEWKEQS